MKQRIRVLEQFDPTDEEVARAERQRPLKLPLCIKCKSKSQMVITGTVRLDLDRIFLAIADVLKGKGAPKLDRADVERLKNLHLHLCRAAHGKYCEPCAQSVKAHVEATLSNGFPT